MRKQRARAADSGQWLSIGPQPTITGGYNFGNSGGGMSAGPCVRPGRGSSRCQCRLSRRGNWRRLENH